jgi:RNA-directed DNA polymerase
MEPQKSAESIVAASGGEGPNSENRTGPIRSMDRIDADNPAERLEQLRRAGGGTAEDAEAARQADPARMGVSGDGTMRLMDEVVSRRNMAAAYTRVVRNRGAAGIDGMTVDELMPYCRTHWPHIREELLSGRYRPRPVRRVMIPKPGGGERMLGIPTVLDRLIQQALLQVLQPIFDPHFSPDSYGFRPGRSAHDALLRAREHVRAGHRWVVDLDLEKFFDRVNHDVLMSRVARRVDDKRVLRLIRRYLQAGMLEGGVVSPRTEGTPQGGPLSPFLSNVLLDEWDRELERRGHRFARYADDCQIYVRSQAAGERVLASLTRFLEQRLRLRVNRAKSAVARPWERTFLGYTFTRHVEARLSVAVSSVQRLKAKLRALWRRGRGRSLRPVITELTPILRGWTGYFRLSDVKGIFEVLDGWIRRRLRVLLWRQWKHPRTRAKRLVQLGLDRLRAYRSAYNGYGPWRNAGASHMNHAVTTRLLRRLGLVSCLDEYHRLARLH